MVEVGVAAVLMRIMLVLDLRLWLMLLLRIKLLLLWLWFLLRWWKRSPWGLGAGVLDLDHIQSLHVLLDSQNLRFLLLLHAVFPVDDGDGVELEQLVHELVDEPDDIVVRHFLAPTNDRFHQGNLLR